MSLLSGLGDLTGANSATALMSPEFMRPWFLKPDMYMAPASTYSVSALKVFEQITSETAVASAANARESTASGARTEGTGQRPTFSPTAPGPRQTPSHPKQYISVEDEEGSVLLSAEAVPADAKAWLRRFASAIQGRLDYARARQRHLEEQLARAGRGRGTGTGTGSAQRSRNSGGPTPAHAESEADNPRPSHKRRPPQSNASPPNSAPTPVTGATHSTEMQSTEQRRPRSSAIALTRQRAADAASSLPGSARSPQMTEPAPAQGGSSGKGSRSAREALAGRAVELSSTEAASALIPVTAVEGSTVLSPPLSSSSSPFRPRSMKYAKRLLPDRTAITPVNTLHTPLMGLRDASSIPPTAEDSHDGGTTTTTTATATAAAAAAAAVTQLRECDRHVPVEVLLQFTIHHLVAFTWGRAGLDAEVALRQLERNLRRLRPFMANTSYVQQLRRAGWTSKKAATHMGECHHHHHASRRDSPSGSSNASGTPAEDSLPSSVPVSWVDVQLLQTYELYEALSLLPSLLRYAGRPLLVVPTQLLLHTAVNEFDEAFSIGSSLADSPSAAAAAPATA